MVHLHRQLAARLDVQQLHLEALAGAELLEEAPRPVAPDVLRVLVAVELLEARDETRDVLRAALVGDEQRVRRVDDDEAVEADGGDERALAVDEAVAGVDEDRIALDGVGLRVARGDLPQRRPRADVAPADVDGHHRRLLRLLHHRVVDGDVGRAREGGAVEAQEPEIVRRFGEGLARRCRASPAPAARARPGRCARAARRCRCSRSSSHRRRRFPRSRGSASRRRHRPR